MKKFCLKLVFIFSIFIVTNLLYKNTNFWKCENDMFKFYNIPDNIQLANLGSSHGLYGINYEYITDINAYNFALQAQPYFYDYAILKKYIKHFSKNATIVIPISYFNISGHFDYSAFRKRYYRILKKKDMDYWNIKEDIIFSKCPILIAKTNIFKIFNDISKEETSPYYNRTKSLDDEAFEHYCVERYNFWQSPDWTEGKIGYKKNIQKVSQIIDLCYSNNLIPVIITLPISETLNLIYEKDVTFFSEFKQFSDDLLKKYPNLIYLDYSRDTQFSPNHQLFADGDHLNNFGAEIFTKRLISDLRNKNLLHF